MDDDRAGESQHDAGGRAATSAPAGAPQRWGVWILLLLLLGALLVRLAHFIAVRDEPFVRLLAMDSQEYDRWARAIAAGDWLGAEAFFQAPLYPYFLGTWYTFFGARLDAVYLAQIALAVCGVFALYRAGAAMGAAAEGLGAAALAALYAPFVLYDVQLLKESLAVTATCFLLWALAAARRTPSGHNVPSGHSGAWLVAGVVLGVLVLLRENALLLVPFLLPLVWLGKNDWRRAGRHAALLLAGLALPLALPAARNLAVSGSFLVTTYQGGVNFYIGNNPDADGTYRPLVPGKEIPALERREPVRLAAEALGYPPSPGQVSRYWLRRSLSWAAREPFAFVRLQARKLLMFWSWYERPDAVDLYWLAERSPVMRLPLLEFGGACLLAAAGAWLARRRLRAYLPAWLFGAGWMAATVVFFLFARYRLPIVPALLLFGGVVVAAAARAVARRQPRRAAALLVVVAAALGLPRLAGFAPRMDLVHYNLGRIDQERGAFDSAREHYRAALELDPRAFLACLNLGNLAVRELDWQAARRFFEQAAAIEPRSDDTASNLGAVYLRTGEPERAREQLERALALNSQNISALQNLAVLHAQRGEFERAAALNQRLLALDPGNPAALRLRARLAGESTTAN